MMFQSIYPSGLDGCEGVALGFVCPICFFFFVFLFIYSSISADHWSWVICLPLKKTIQPRNLQVVNYYSSNLSFELFY